MTRYSVQVTQREIDKAEPKQSGLCMAAMAIKRTIPDARNVDVDLRTIRFTLAGERHIYLTPYSVSGYVIAYDAGDDVHPFRFTLREDQRVIGEAQRRTFCGTREEERQPECSTGEGEGGICSRKPLSWRRPCRRPIRTK